MWRPRKLTLEGKLIIFKKLGLSKFVFLAQVLLISNEIISAIHRMQMEFLQNSSNVKIKNETICNNFQNGGLKNVALKLSGRKTKRLNSRDWKLIPMHFIKMHLGKTLFFIQILSFKTSVLYQFPTAQTFLNRAKETFLIHLTLLVV